MVQRIIDDKIDLDEAKRSVALYEEAVRNEILRPLATALAEGEMSSGSADKTIKLYSRIQRDGLKLDPEAISRDIDEIKRQTALNDIHEKLIEDARMAILTGRKKALDFRISDPGENFVREVSDVAWKVQRWGMPNLMEVGAERWKIASNYFREIESRMRSLLGSVIKENQS